MNEQNIRSEIARLQFRIRELDERLEFCRRTGQFIEGQQVMDTKAECLRRLAYLDILLHHGDAEAVGVTS